MRTSRFAGKVDALDEFFAASLPTTLTPADPHVVSDEVSDLKSSTTQIACLLQQVQNLTNRASKLISHRSEKQLSSRPRSTSWSVAECFDHLALTTRTFAPLLAAAIGAAPKLNQDRALRSGRLARLVVRSLEPPYRLRHKVLACLAPQNRDFLPAWRSFVDSQAEFTEVICSTMGLAIDQITIQSPACTRVSYSVYGALEILTAHQRRHLWQVERILTALDRRAA